MTIHFSWFFLFLSLDLGDAALIEEALSGRYCNTNAVDIYADIDSVSQNTSLTFAEAKEKCRLACQSAYAYSPSISCSSSSECTHPGSLCLGGQCTVRGGGFTIGTDEAGCTDTDKCRCRSYDWWDCTPESNRAEISGNCERSFEFIAPDFMQDEEPVWYKLGLQVLDGVNTADLIRIVASSGSPSSQPINSYFKTKGWPTTDYLDDEFAEIEVMANFTISSSSFNTESHSSCRYDYLSVASSRHPGWNGQHSTVQCKQYNNLLSDDSTGQRCTKFCGTNGPQALKVGRGDSIRWISDGAAPRGDGFLIGTAVAASTVTCVASSDPALTTPDPLTGEFFCVDGDISGTVQTSCTCTPKACIIQSPMTESWHKNCRSDSTATGTAGNCKCSCVEDAWGGDKAKGGRCITDIDECDDSDNGVANSKRAAERCSPQATCTNRGINNGYECACPNGWETATSSDFVAVDQTECLLQSTIDAVTAILPPSRPYGSSGAGNEGVVNVNWKGEGCIFYTLDPTFGNSGANDRVVFNTGTFSVQSDNRASYSICKCADCDQTYHLVTTPYQACSAYTPVEGHACRRKDCVDVDTASDTWEIECVNGDAAGVSESCTCTCPSVGGKFTWEGDYCQTDVDECQNTNPDNAQHNCDMVLGGCSNTDGGFTCTCNAGYSLNADGFTCDADDCVEGDGLPDELWEKSGCLNDAIVVGTTGSCSCDCTEDADGKKLWFGGSCGNDVNECTNTNADRAVDTCTTSGQCINEAGGHDCTCDETATQGGGAADIIYCDNGATATGTRDTGCACDCSTTGSLWNGTNCDECTNTGAGCLVGGQAGVFSGQCRCVCPLIQQAQNGNNALVFIAYGTVCENDVNECTNVPGSVGYDPTTATNTCSDDATCTDLVGSANPTVQGWSCACNYGFEGDGETCTLKQCVQSDGVAPLEAWEINCVNGDVVGSSGNCACDCPTGYDNLDTWKFSFCGTDVNECDNVFGEPGYNSAHSSNNCNANAECTNNDGGFSCTCNAGYSGNGVTCTADPCTLATDLAENNPDEGVIWCNSVGTAAGNTGDPCTCVCPSDSNGLLQWFGGNCGNNVNECTNTNPARAVDDCHTFATCTDNPLGTFSCACNAGYSGNGTYCEADDCVLADPADDPWEVTNCQNDATAGGTTGQCFCDCAEDFFGLKTWFGGTCGNDVDECTNTNPARAVHNCSADATCGDIDGGFTCTCNPGYTGDGVTCNFAQCEVVAIPTQINHIPCLYGTANGVAYSCSCDCINGFSGLLCNECAAGLGFDGGSCVACQNTQANDLTTHAAPCADQQCAAGFGVNTDSFNFTLDPTNTGTANCVACTGKQASPAGNGVCITQTCGDDQQVVITGFDNTLDPTSPNANCESCAAGFQSTAGVDPTCTDINECISTDNPNFPQLCDFTGTLSCNTAEGPNKRECVCKPGYSGDRCQTNVNECDPNPCQNGASCVDLVADYTCICPLNSHGSNPVAGWTGKNCTDDVNECDSFTTNDCDFGESTCTNTPGDFNCTCNGGYVGDGTTCNPAPCALGTGNEAWTIDCNGRGSAGGLNDVIGCFCICDQVQNNIGGQAWTGTNCENNQNECNMAGNNNCDANAQCTDTEGDFFCTCDAEYDGDGVTCTLKQCIEAVTPDSWTIDCSGNGNVTGVAGSCGCDCSATNHIGAPAFSGPNCEVNIDECSDGALNNCDVNGQCTDTVGDFFCSCNAGYEFVQSDYYQVMDQTECLSSTLVDQIYDLVPSRFSDTDYHPGSMAPASGNWAFVAAGCVYYVKPDIPTQNKVVFSTTPQTGFYGDRLSFLICKSDTLSPTYDLLTDISFTCDDIVSDFNCTASDCVTSNVATTNPGEVYCLHGNATGVTGSCECVCEDGWEGTNCDQDLNECLLETDNCLPYHICNNTPGSYFCWCKFGFISDGAGYPACTCDVGKNYNATLGTCQNCVYPTTNDQQNSECVHAECLQDQYIEPDDGSFTNFLPFNHVSNCAACWPGKFSDDALSTDCDDTNECDAGIAATCGEFDDNGTLVPMGACNESSQDDTIALTFFRCTPNPGFDCPAINGPCTDTTECDANPCTGGPNTASCDDTYTSADPTGFVCTCNPGYSGPLCETAAACNSTLNPSDSGLDGNYYCRYGDIGGITGTCICTCNDGFTGSHCDICVAGSGFFNDTCELCSNPFTNNQVTHDAPCVNQTCGLNRGIVIDGLAFNNELNGSTDNANCEDCPPGMESPDGSGICSAIICGANEKVINHACVPCEMGALNLDGGDDASGNNTECDGVPCTQNERVEANVCVLCPMGTTNAAGDLRNGQDTFCDPILCLENEKVVNNLCVPCQPGAENEAGDDASGLNTACEAILCDVNEYVSANNCTPCAPPYVNLAGDDATQPDTACILGCLENERVENNICVPCPESYVYPAGAIPEGPDTECLYEGTCGSSDLGFVWCDQNNTYICANDMCACKPGFVGRECTADALADDSPSTQKKLDLVESYAPDEALPDDETIIIFQQNLAVHLSDIVTGFVQQGGNTINSVFQHTVEIDRLTKRQQIVVGDTKTLLAAAPMLGDDDCATNGALSRHCSSFNYRGVDEIVFLQTPKGFWSVVVKAETLVSKQTSINNTDFEMQCWVGSAWGPKVTKYRDDLIMCNGFVILMGSQAPLCQATVTETTGHIIPGTCGVHGQCAIDGLSYTCLCSPGFTGEFCEQVYVQPTHCHEVDCNNYGGYNTSVGLVPTPMLQADLVPYCCNYDTRADFDSVCDGETQAQAYANLGCCSRTFCV